MVGQFFDGEKNFLIVAFKLEIVLRQGQYNRTNAKLFQLVVDITLHEA